jgi:uncharacterized membrane protein
MQSIRKNVVLLGFFCVFMVVCRYAKTAEFSFVFLLWNLFLALVPYGVSAYMVRQTKMKLFKLLGLSGLWLLFLPNAPYMLTDLFHLHKRAYLPVWFDLVLILSFAVTGLYLFYISVYQMTGFIKARLPQLYKPLFLVLLFLMVSYGVYIGRFLRVNSWDVIHPFGLAKTCLVPLFHFHSLKDVCSFTFIFSVFLAFLYLVFKPLSKSTTYHG